MVSRLLKPDEMMNRRELLLDFRTQAVKPFHIVSGDGLKAPVYFRLQIVFPDKALIGRR